MICLEVPRKITKNLTVDRFLAKMCTRDLQNMKWQKYRYGRYTLTQLECYDLPCCYF
jgi:hypothetical protein